MRLMPSGVGIAALTATGLRTLVIDKTAIALRALVEHRDDLVKSRTQTVNRLHRLLIQLIPAGAPQRLSAKTPAELLGTVDPQTPMLRTLHAPASDLISEIRRLDERIAATTAQIITAVAASGTTLTQLRGIGTLLAGKILALVGSITVSSSGRLDQHPRAHSPYLASTSRRPSCTPESVSPMSWVWCLQNSGLLPWAAVPGPSLLRCGSHSDRCR